MATYRLNEEKNGVEITFDAKPSEEIREELKKNGFRWGKGFWWAKQTAERIELAKRLAGGEEWKDLPGATNAPKGMKWQSNGKSRFSGEYKHRLVPVDEQKEKKQPSAKKHAAAILEAYKAHWPQSKKMVDYCVGKVAAVAETSKGLLPIDKQRIETSFCYDDSFDDMKEPDMQSHALAENARTNEAHLRRENLKEFEKTIAMIKEQIKDPLPDHPFQIMALKDYGNGLACIRWMTAPEVVNGLGGSCTTEETRGATVKDRWSEGAYIPTVDELKAILAAYEEAYAAHVKKVDAYIKRYGTSKVHAWTYWGMA